VGIAILSAKACALCGRPSTLLQAAASVKTVTTYKRLLPFVSGKHVPDSVKYWDEKLDLFVQPTATGQGLSWTPPGICCMAAFVAFSNDASCEGA